MGYNLVSQRYGLTFNNLLLRRLSTSQRNFQDPEESSDPDSDSESEKSNSYVDLKLQILKAALEFVPEHGWSKNSLSLGVQSLGLSSASHSLIEDGHTDLVHYFNILCNENLEDYLKQKYPSNIEQTDIQNYIEDALEYRLSMVIPHVHKWPEALALMVPPAQFITDSKTLLDLTDIIWNHMGESSLNTRWYTKRISLAIVYRMCELSLVQDKSPEYSDTFHFLRRRVADIIETGKCLDEIKEGAQNFPERASGVTITVANIIGVNRWFR